MMRLYCNGLMAMRIMVIMKTGACVRKGGASHFHIIKNTIRDGGSTALQLLTLFTLLKQLTLLILDKVYTVHQFQGLHY